MTDLENQRKRAGSFEEDTPISKKSRELSPQIKQEHPSSPLVSIKQEQGPSNSSSVTIEPEQLPPIPLAAHPVEQSHVPVEETVSDNLLCKGCGTKYEDPRLLPCLHTFCLSCLSKWSNGGGSSSMACPVDGKAHTLPSNGVEGLRPNFMTKDLIEVHDVMKGRKTIMCKFCRDCGQQKATFRCSTCKMYLCEGAAGMHRGTRATYDHDLRPFNCALHGEVGRALLEMRTSHCASHPDQALECFCEPCQLPVCSKCVLYTHKGHQYKTLEDLEGPLRESISALVKETSTRMGVVEGSIAKVNERSEEIETQANELSNRAELLVKKVSTSLEEARGRVLAGIQSRKEAKLGGLLSQRNAHSTLLSSSRISLSFAADMLTSGCVSDLLTHKALITSRLEEIKSQWIQLEPSEAADMKMYSDVNKVLEEANTFISLDKPNALKENLEKQLADTKQENSVLRSDLQTVKKTFVDMQTRSVKMNMELLKSKRVLEQKTQENVGLRSDLQTAQQKLTVLRQESTRLNNELQKSKRDLEQKSKASVPKASLHQEPPKRKDRVKILHGDNQGLTGLLLGIDGFDGIVKMDDN
mmetsp:Transcript_31039/g.50204  ORF Transcript_31039/g.50204 Transcript_31039/m.50204 type:complete len:584 (+) Transcript_31039:190-1941(+)|eukprot:CAMPEP_0184664992 /NCGR_PEP_ID=MMETSP0308-20130426/55191_1 /TAXON_ID=38269 /ORGANISM="Gloeochaete witrockiana, Strain SAG 46.84" /LENGTH=583 /DNA_ID=CAMNT_0027108725 /DNA_START=128 /DNA_END=1879 /DNA_ORIENTATION=-